MNVSNADRLSLKNIFVTLKVHFHTFIVTGLELIIHLTTILLSESCVIHSFKKC